MKPLNTKLILSFALILFAIGCSGEADFFGSGVSTSLVGKEEKDSTSDSPAGNNNGDNKANSDGAKDDSAGNDSAKDGDDDLASGDKAYCWVAVAETASIPGNTLYECKEHQWAKGNISPISGELPPPSLKMCFKTMLQCEQSLECRKASYDPSSGGFDVDCLSKP